jgi:hypothetical protein
VIFELRHQDSANLIHQYPTEGAALAFIRDVLRVGGRDKAAQFSLAEHHEGGENRIITIGELLVQRALEDRAE